MAQNHSDFCDKGRFIIDRNKFDAQHGHRAHRNRFQPPLGDRISTRPPGRRQGENAAFSAARFRRLRSARQISRRRDQRGGIDAAATNAARIKTAARAAAIIERATYRFDRGT
jgi:hypothetical protein